MAKKRIWELDALRGLFILGMVAVHFIYDLVELYALVDWKYPPIFLFIKNWGGILFLLISGICVTLGSHSVRRGLVVFSGGMLCTLVTVGMYALHFADSGIIIYFGVLQCLGCCMLLWPLFRKVPWWALLGTGILLVAAGFFLLHVPAPDYPWLMPLGLPWKGFISSDYFPLLPNLGYFLLGAFLGRTLYKNKESLLPNVSTDNPVIRFLLLCGKHSLWIYLLHQPVLSAVFSLIIALF